MSDAEESVVASVSAFLVDGPVRNTISGMAAKFDDNIGQIVHAIECVGWGIRDVDLHNFPSRRRPGRNFLTVAAAMNLFHDRAGDFELILVLERGD